MSQLLKTKRKQAPKESGLDFLLLNYMFHHPNIPFNVKTLLFIVRNTTYKKNYLEVQLPKLRRKGYIYEPVLGIFMMTPSCFLRIEEENPDFAKKIMLKAKYVEEF